MSRADESRAGTTALAIIISPAIAAITVALRIYTRRVLAGVRFVEDYCIVGAMVCSIIMSVFMGIVVVYGYGRHIETISSWELVQQVKFSLGGVIFYVLTHMALKLSILLQYVRISVMSFEKWLCYAIIMLLLGQSIAFIGTHLGICKPFYAAWTANVPGAVCLDRTMVIYSQLGITIAMDFLVLLAPVFILRHLSLPWIQRLLILVVLSFGGMACIISVIRLLSILHHAQSKDSTYDKVGSAVYGVIEPNLGIFCASIVTLRPLFNRFTAQASQRPSLADGDNNNNRCAERGNGNEGNGTAPPWPRRPAFFSASSTSDAEKSFALSSSDMSGSMSHGQSQCQEK